MKIYLRELSEEAKEYHFSEKEPWLLETVLSVDEVDPAFYKNPSRPNHPSAASPKTRPIHLDINIRLVDEIIIVEGDFDTSAELICSRCAVRFLQPFKARFHELLSDDPKVTTQGKGAENVTPVTKDFIDLKDILTEQLHLQVPLRPLCNEACKGICANCGADLNSGRCACDKIKKESPFSVLKDFAIKGKRIND